MSNSKSVSVNRFNRTVARQELRRSNASGVHTSKRFKGTRSECKRRALNDY